MAIPPPLTPRYRCPGCGRRGPYRVLGEVGAVVILGCDVLGGGCGARAYLERVPLAPPGRLWRGPRKAGVWLGPRVPAAELLLRNADGPKAVRIKAARGRTRPGVKAPG